MPKKERQRPVHLPSQEELDNCKTIQDKFLLKPPDFFYELNERGMSKAFSEIMHPILVFNAGRNDNSRISLCFGHFFYLA